MGVVRRGNKLCFRFREPPTAKHPKGRWTTKASSYLVGQESEAEKAFRALTRGLSAEKELFPAKVGPITLLDYCERKFFPDRRQLLADALSDETRVKHALHMRTGPVAHPAREGSGLRLGDMPARDVRARHLIDVFKKLRARSEADGSPTHAPHSIYNIYGVIKALFRELLVDELIDANPCVLKPIDLGPNEDKDPEWRSSAYFMRDEIEQLISDPRLPADRQIIYGLKAMGATRNGEACALRWSHWDAHAAASGALGKLVIAKSHSNYRTKTGRGREMPVHPVLAAMLAEWRLSGWPAMMGRKPEPNDLIVPMGEPERGENIAIHYPDAPPVTRPVPGQVLTLADAAKRLGRSTKSLLDYVATGRLRSTRVELTNHSKGHPAHLFRVADLDLFIATNKARNWGKGRRAEKGSMRTNSIVQKQFVEDLEMLGLRHRRGHDLRTSFITLAQEDGAQQLILEQCTHTPKKGAKAIAGYTIYSWPVKSAEVAKFRVQRRTSRGELVTLPRAVGAGGVGMSVSAMLPSTTRHISSHHTSNTSESLMNNLEAAGIEPVARHLGERSQAQSSEHSALGGGDLAGAGRAPSEADGSRRNGDCDDVTSGDYEARARALGFRVVPGKRKP